jgi:hypothetical protein
MRALIVAKGCSTVSRRWRMACGFSSSRRCTASRMCSCCHQVMHRSLPDVHRAERAIADRLRALREGMLPWPHVDPAKAIPWVESKAGITLAESQRAALRLALLSKVLIITGGWQVMPDGLGRTATCGRASRRGHRPAPRRTRTPTSPRWGAPVAARTYELAPRSQI